MLGTYKPRKFKRYGGTVEGTALVTFQNGRTGELQIDLTAPNGTEYRVSAELLRVLFGADYEQACIGAKVRLKATLVTRGRRNK